MLIKEIKETNGNHRITLSKVELEKIGIKAGDYVEIKKLGEEDDKD